MTKREIAALACKILSLSAIVFFLNNAQYLVPQILMLATKASPETIKTIPYVLFSLAGSSLLPIFSWILWSRADKIAARMVSEDENNRAHTGLSADDALHVGFAILGLVLLTTAAKDAAREVMDYLSASRNEELAPLLKTQLRDAQWIARLGATGVQLVLGIWLLLGARGLVNFLKSLRGTGRRGQPEAVNL